MVNHVSQATRETHKAHLNLRIVQLECTPFRDKLFDFIVQHIAEQRKRGHDLDDVVVFQDGIHFIDDEIESEDNYRKRKQLKTKRTMQTQLITDKMHFADNNLKYEAKETGLGKTYISSASHYPPQPSDEATVGALLDDNTCTNRGFHAESGLRVITDDKLTMKNSYMLYQNDYVNSELLSNTAIEIDHAITDTKAIVSTIDELQFVDDELEQVINAKNEIIINNKNLRWQVKVPIRNERGDIEETRVFADPGANTGCVSTAWAVKNFGSMIKKNNKQSTIKTPGGPVTPKYVLWLAFPMKSGRILKARMYLMDDLPVPILADINMLKAFGYNFVDEVPPVFRHPAKKDLDLELLEDDELTKIHKVETVEPNHEGWLKAYKQIKHEYHSRGQYKLLKPGMYESLHAGDQCLYLEGQGSLIT